ncbi:hypothetical protein [Kitasatospora sp. GP82]|uniref:hypothetical protein n=1 Tax=Kitasatospora sp. GP82 TaxID=3035089 RepID=UPI002476BB0D|nr:hypothetical protein [Kitasatospora sp. GP82]MDH6125694.1 hypothetical protein [Kitasatospora sp. GP82]
MNVSQAVALLRQAAAHPAVRCAAGCLLALAAAEPRDRSALAGAARPTTRTPGTCG